MMDRTKLHASLLALTFAAASPALAQQQGEQAPPQSGDGPSAKVNTSNLGDATMKTVDKRVTDQMEGKLAYYNGQLQGFITTVNREKDYLSVALGKGDPIRVPLDKATPTNQGTVALEVDPSTLTS